MRLVDKNSLSGRQIHQATCLECWDHAKVIKSVTDKVSNDRSTTTMDLYREIYRYVHFEANGDHLYSPKPKTKRKAGKLLSM